MSSLLHATLVEYKFKGLLIQGSSGVGKSDLALRLISRGGRLVADDQVSVRDCTLNKKLIGQSPSSIQGLLEVRGLGIFRFPAHPSWSIDIAISLQPLTNVPRFPEIETQVVFSHHLPCFTLNAFEASVLEKIDLLIHPKIEGKY